uniref:glycoside hydrolase family 104 protein n=1 Tax=Cyanobium sp. TaxID=2164130 RepID=UPI004047C10D
MNGLLLSRFSSLVVFSVAALAPYGLGTAPAGAQAEQPSTEQLSTEKLSTEKFTTETLTTETARTQLLFRLPPPAPLIFAITPERRALLNTIRYAEGTWAGGDQIGYRIMFGGGLMPSLERHPDRVVRKSGYASAAAGAYQFMPFTWSLASRTLGLAAFGPEVQDQAAIFLIQRRGALPLADQGLFTRNLAAKLAPEWASFPTLAGRSFYGQPVRRFNELRRFYEDNLAQLRGLEPVAQVQKASCEPADSLFCRVEALQRLP